MKGRTMKVWRIGGLAVSAILILSLTACGDDDDVEDAFDAAEDLASDFDESDFSDLSDFGSDFSDFSDFGSDFDFGGVTDACAEADGGDDISTGDSVDGEIEDSQEVVSYQFTGGGDTIDVAVDQADDSQLDPIVTICDSDGEEVARDDDGGGFPNSLISDFDADDGEDYLIVVSAFAGTGEYELAID